MSGWGDEMTPYVPTPEVVEEAEVEAHRVETDTGYAPDTWEFDPEVTRVFDDMLQRSIPDYERMRDWVTDVACAFVQQGTLVVDLTRYAGTWYEVARVPNWVQKKGVRETAAG